MPTVFVPDVAITLETITCCLCAVPFAVPADLKRERLRDHRNFWCPNGHDQHFLGKTEADKLREQLAAKGREVAAAESRAEYQEARRWEAVEATAKVTRSLRATRAVVTRTKKKIVAGRCPCCSHKFKDLASHMTTRHPNYDPEKAATALEAKAE